MRHDGPEKGLMINGGPATANGDSLLGHLALLAGRVEQAAQREQFVRDALHHVHRQLAERDDQIARLTDAGHDIGEDRLRTLAAYCEQLETELGTTRERLAYSEARLAAMSATRAWRTACAWWGLRDSIRSR